MKTNIGKTMTEKDSKIKMPEVVKEMDFDGDVVITDPCYIAPSGGKWENWWENMPDGMMSTSTIYGDWGCTSYGRDPSSVIGWKKLGRFCADSGMVCACTMDTTKKWNPDFPKWLREHSHCGTVIRKFRGKISFVKYEREYDEDGKTMKYEHLEVHGEGTRSGKPFVYLGYQTEL